MVRKTWIVVKFDKWGIRAQGISWKITEFMNLTHRTKTEICRNGLELDAKFEMKLLWVDKCKTRGLAWICEFLISAGGNSSSLCWFRLHQHGNGNEGIYPNLILITHSFYMEVWGVRNFGQGSKTHKIHIIHE